MASAVPSTGARPGAVGFLTDASLCIGCKACEVACKQWNQLPADGFAFSGRSYDNTLDLGATTWRHVVFAESTEDLLRPMLAGNPEPQVAWLMLSDVCKHCVNAGCMEACPTGAIIRTEYDTVFIQPDICNGCGYCVPACPFGVPKLGDDHIAHKCTLCYDRLRDGLEPACAKSCPTDSIRFGPIDELLPAATARVEELRARGFTEAQLYGDRETGGTGGMDGLNALFVLTAPPEAYHLPARPELPQQRARAAYLSTAITALGMGIAAWRVLRERR